MTKDLMTCPIENTLKLINRKWTVVLIRDMFLGKKHFLEFKENKSNLSNTVLADTLRFMENNDLVEKKTAVGENRNSTEYYLTDKGFKLNRILYEMAVFGLDEFECSDGGDAEVIGMFKKYYGEVFHVGE